MFELLEFQVKVTALFVGVGVVDCLNREFTHAHHHVGDFVGRALRRLNQGDSVTRIANRHIQTANLVGHARGNRHAGRIVSGGIDPFAGR